MSDVTPTPSPSSPHPRRRFFRRAAIATLIAGVATGIGVNLEGQPVTVPGDSRLLRRMIRKLLDNARRHGTPPIRVRVSRAGAGAELRVCDQGPGVPASESEAVFRPFFRFAGAGEHAGAGLGLALVGQIARRHGGDARYLGRQPDGSCFVVSLDASG